MVARTVHTAVLFSDDEYGQLITVDCYQIGCQSEVSSQKENTDSSARTHPVGHSKHRDRRVLRCVVVVAASVNQNHT